MIPSGPRTYAEPVAVLVALQLADELRAAGSQAGKDGVDVLDGECDVANARRVRRRVPVVGLARRRVELHQLQSSVAVRSLHHRSVRPDALEPHDAIHPAALDRPLALQLESDSTKTSVAAGRSSTTTPTCSIRWIVMCSMVRNPGSSRCRARGLRAAGTDHAQAVVKPAFDLYATVSKSRCACHYR